MNTYAVYLYPRGRLASALSSETLFGAVCWGIQTLGGDVGALLAHFTPPRFAFSAAFPMLASKDTRLRFYPRPVTLDLTPAIVRKVATDRAAQQHSALKTVQVEVADTIKRELKPVNYLSESMLARVALGQFTAEQWLLAVLNRSKDIVRVGTLLLTGDELRHWPRQTDRALPLTSSWPRLHNQIDRVAGATVEGLLFYQNETHFAPGAGLWAALRASPQDVETFIRPALRYLQDTGLGANRTVGQGHFAIILETLTTLPDGGAQANGFMSLSRYLPVRGEVSTTGEPLAYRLITLRGKRESKYPDPDRGAATPPIFKRSLRVFEPGSVFPLTQRREVYGRLAEAIPAEGETGATYQSGLALPIFLRAASEERP